MSTITVPSGSLVRENTTCPVNAGASCSSCGLGTTPGCSPIASSRGCACAPRAATTAAKAPIRIDKRNDSRLLNAGADNSPSSRHHRFVVEPFPDHHHDLCNVVKGPVVAVAALHLGQIEYRDVLLRKHVAIWRLLGVYVAETLTAAPDELRQAECPVILGNEQRKPRSRIAHSLDLRAKHVDVHIRRHQENISD